MYKERVQRKLVMFVLLGMVLAAGLWLARLANGAAAISFLPARSPAQWLVYPKPTVPHLQAVAELPTTFRRSFNLAHVPTQARLSWCACRSAVVSLNGKALPGPAAARSWKEPQSLDVTSDLRLGENQVSVTVLNPLGPPALWLSLRGEGVQLDTDAAWQASYAGAVWRPARLAAQALSAGQGSPFRGSDTSLAWVQSHWLAGSAALLACMALVALCRWWFGRAARRPLPRRGQWSAQPGTVLMGLIVLLWLALVTHNLGLVPRSAGFDSEGHLAYIQYLQQHHALPLADEGWEMHQPPLYYVLSASVLGALGLSAQSFDGLAVLRLLALGIGLAQVGVVFLSLRLLFPHAVGKQLTGLVLAGFLPMQLYLAHYVTNETLAACLMSATLYLTLRLVLEPNSTWRLFLALGATLGLALLTKVTALVLVPFVLAALLYRVCQPGVASAKPSASPVARWALPALCLGVCLGVCGWHYWRVWRHFGHAFFVPTHWAYAVSWWQDPGYHSAAYFTRFGRALTAPLFSGIASFWDGLYTTLWGDGLCGGAAGVRFRPPWNYELMAGGYLLALLPTLLILFGALGLLVRTVRRVVSPHTIPANASSPADGATLPWLGLLGFAFAMLLAIVHLNLEVPAYAEAKAIFGLAALIPLCVFAAMGWGVLGAKLRGVGFVVSVLLCFWALTSYASFWCNADSAATQAAVGRGLMKEGNLAGGIRQFQRALQYEPHHVVAESFLVTALLQQDQLAEALRVAQDAAASHPNEASCQLDLAQVLERQGQKLEALEPTRRAVELAPDYPEARLKLASLLFQLHRYPNTISACREALRLTPADPEVHYLLASALAFEAQQPDPASTNAGGESLLRGSGSALSTREVLTAEAINHFYFTLRLAPDTPEALNHLAWLLATHPRAELRDGPEAVRLAERACALTENRNPAVLLTLAAAYAEAGRYPLAANTASEAEKVAEAAGNTPGRERSQRLQALFQSQRPFRQTLPPDPSK